MRQILIFAMNAIVAIALLSCVPGTDDRQSHNHEIWFRYPAKYWNSQALHLGNGSIGASFFGGVEQEKFTLTEKSMWHGGPFRGDWEEVGLNPRALATLPAIRKAVVERRIAEADSLVQHNFLGDSKRFGSFSTIGDLMFSQDTAGEPIDYRRSLDMSRSIGTVAYQVNNTKYTREYFCSYPDSLLVLRWTASEANKISTTMSVSILQKIHTIAVFADGLEISGRIEDNDRPFVVSVRVLVDGGETIADSSSLRVVNATSLEVRVAVSTNYKLQYPDYVGGDPLDRNRAILEAARTRSYEELKQRHVTDYQQLYQRVSLDLNGDRQKEALPTNERWENLRNGDRDPGLKELAFNLGRYLLISSSRPGSLPANLQGGWNTFNSAVWAGNYQSNINIQEIYWPCGPVNLLECHEPWLNWIEDLVVPGREVARRVYGTRGWVSHTTGNIWGHVTGDGSLPWAMYPVGAAWHCQHLWDQFTFTLDTTYLRKRAYPIMKEAAAFWMENLVPFEGYLISVPTVSAEHGAMERDGVLDPATHELRHPDYRFNIPGVYQDVEMIWDLFTNTAEAARLFNEDAFADSLSSLRARLLPLKIGRHGQLQEWYDDIDSPEGHHRHIAHLYAVSPGRQIHPTTTPDLARAAARSLNMRGDVRFLEQEHPSGGNWSRAHRIASWVRLMDGNRANKIFSELLADEGFENLTTFQHANWSMGRPDLFKENDSTFLYFQLDATAATPAFMAEMLLQTHMGELHLLPALPDEWPTGQVKGLLARGGHVVDISWENGALREVTIHQRKGVTLQHIRVVNDLISASDPRVNIIAQ
jgi:alpha-L-fucosidase 2